MTSPTQAELDAYYQCIDDWNAAMPDTGFWNEIVPSALPPYRSWLETQCPECGGHNVSKERHLHVTSTLKLITDWQNQLKVGGEQPKTNGFRVTLAEAKRNFAKLERLAADAIVLCATCNR
jgi:hypothetical protein